MNRLVKLFVLLLSLAGWGLWGGKALATPNIFQFTSVAHSAGATVGSMGYIERSLSASMEK